jgi:hypothetical protein
MRSAADGKKQMFFFPLIRDDPMLSEKEIIAAKTGVCIGLGSASLLANILS